MANTRNSNISPTFKQYGPYLAGAGLGLGALGSFFNNPTNPAESANDYFNRIPGELHGAIDPWLGYSRDFMSDPTASLNRIGSGYKQSPGFQFAMQQALQGGQHAAAAGGMAGSPQSQQQQMQLASDIASQDYQNYIKNALGIQQMGYTGGMAGAMGLGQDLSSNLAQQGQFSYAGQAAQNQAQAQPWEQLFSAGAAMLPFLL